MTNEKQRPQKGKKEKEKSTLLTCEKQKTQKKRKEKKSITCKTLEFLIVDPHNINRNELNIT
jgi:hypothetical protein